MSHASELLQAAMYAHESEMDVKRALSLASQIIAEHPDTVEAENAAQLIARLDGHSKQEAGFASPQVSAEADDADTESATQRGARWLLKAILIGALLTASASVMAFAFFAFIFTGGAEEVVNAVMTFGVIVVLVVMAIVGFKRAGIVIGIAAVLVMMSFFGAIFG